MTVTFNATARRFELRCEMAENALPKSLGFEWDPNGRCWYGFNGHDLILGRLGPYLDASALERARLDLFRGNRGLAMAAHEEDGSTIAELEAAFRHPIQARFADVPKDTRTRLRLTGEPLNAVDAVLFSESIVLYEWKPRARGAWKEARARTEAGLRRARGEKSGEDPPDVRALVLEGLRAIAAGDRRAVLEAVEALTEEQAALGLEALRKHRERVPRRIAERLGFDLDPPTREHLARTMKDRNDDRHARPDPDPNNGEEIQSWELDDPNP